MNMKMDYKDEIAIRINNIVNLNLEDVRNYIEIPPNSEMGDYAFPCFKLAKDLHKAPPVIAEEIKTKLAEGELPFIERIETVGGYLNIFIDKTSLVKNVLESVIEQDDEYGRSDIGNGKKVLIDYSAPNIAKPFHIGHLRSTVIGGALYKMYKFSGYDVVGINHIGDWGMGVCKSITGYNMWKDEYDFSINPIDSISKIYARFSKSETDELHEEVRKALKRLEDGDEETVRLWKWIIDISIEEYKKVYNLIGCEFDSYNGEAFYNDKMDRVINELKEKGLLVESEGAQVVMLGDDMPPCIIITSAGTTIYATRDLAALLYRIDTYNFDKMIYVVGGEQSLHFKQIFKVLGLMGYEKYANECEHIPFGLILDSNGEKIGSRKGNAITLLDIFNEAIEKSTSIIEQKNPALEDKAEVAKMVGVGAIIFNDLSNNRIKDEIFDWDQVLNFNGETGPYMQYTYVRTQSILRNAGEISNEVDYTKLLDKESIQVIKDISNFTDTLKSGTEKNEPSILARYLINLAQDFSRFYNEHHIICDDKETQNARLILTKSVGNVIKNGLSLLGIECPEKM